MDRRQKKTRRAILASFRALLEKKRYEHITVQEIIDGADVGRSTFYSHFETKDMLLDALAGEIFQHIFEDDPCPWVGKDGELEGKLSHILWHIRAERENLAGVLLSDSGELFMGYFKNHLKAVFTQYIDNFTQDVPRGFLIEYLSGSFAETVRWWIKEGMKTSPEDVAKYFMGMVNRK
ncbi:MAG: TetR/AcrR family transcriptional regulator [Clostridia bacterium]|nr:TetR/AcrR family transcriptional regulator [Clostridia bacterium]